jgi:MFS family permease
MPHPYLVHPIHYHANPLDWQMFSALRHRNFRLLWSANLVSNFGTSTYILAINWIAVREHGALGLAAITLAYGALQFLFQLVGGSVSDRFNRKAVFFTTELFMTVIAFVLAGCASFQFIPLWLLALVNGINGGISAFDTPARTTLINESVPPEDLLDAQELYGTAANATSIIGPALGGILLGVGHVALAFWFNALSFIPILLSIGLLKMNVSSVSQQKEPIIQSIDECIKYIRDEKVLRTLILLITVIMVLGLPYQTLLPIFTHKVLHLGSSEFAALSSVSGFGTFVGAVLATNLVVTRKPGPLILGTGLLFALALFLFSQSFIIHLALLSIFLAGLCSTVALNLDTGLIQLLTPSDLRGRVTSISNLNKGGLSLSASLASFCSHFWGMVVTQVILVGLLVLGLLWLRPRLINLKVAPPPSISKSI